MTKPRGYQQSAMEECFGFFVVCLPYYQTLLIAGTTGAISVVLLACMLVFVVESSPAICRKVAQSLQRLPLDWLPAPLANSVAPIFDPGARAWEAPSLAQSFQRPPPLFA